MLIKDVTKGEKIKITAMINLLLEKALNDHSLIGIRTEAQEWDELIIGFITEKEKTSIIINEIDEYGKNIGNTSIEIDEILSIDVNDRYQQRLAFLHKNSNLLNSNDHVTIWKRGNSLLKYLSNLIENKEIVTLYFDDEEYVMGTIIKFDEKYVVIGNLSSEGVNDGVSYHLVVNLSGIRYKGVPEQKVQLLLNNKHLFQE